MHVWYVEKDPFEELAAVEDIQDFEQQQEFVEGKSLLHSIRDLITTSWVLQHQF
jgi:predicted nucleotidyltransferase